MSYVDHNTEGVLEESVALALVQQCTSNKEDCPDDWDPVETMITVSNSIESPVSVDEYPIDSSDVRIIFSYGRTAEAGWDGDFNAFVIFSFNKGFGVAADVGWWGPTFTGHKYTLDICETDDYHKFDRLCLTDEIRNKFSLINYELER